MDPGEILVSAVRQVLSEAKPTETPPGLVSLGKTPSKGLLRVEFSFEGCPVVVIEQNPNKGSQWAKVAPAIRWCRTARPRRAALYRERGGWQGSTHLTVQADKCWAA
ncbi:MAG: hypothetical protein ABSF71_29810 [Terriglobia bacterium]